MNAQRFVAPTSREAMALAKSAFGESAVILSSRSTEQGFEVIATAEELLAGLSTVSSSGSHTLAARSGQAGAGGRRGQSLQQRAAQQLPPVSEHSSVAQDTETLAMSTLSFQDYVRERMLRKRREALQPASPVPVRTGLARVSSGVNAEPADDAMTLPFARPPQAARSVPTPTQPRAKAAVAAASPAKPARDTGTPAPGSTAARLAEQLQTMQSMMEERFNTLAWLGQAKQRPVQSGLMHKLLRAGYSPTVARAVMERLPEAYGAAEGFRWTLEVLTRNLRTSRDAGALCDEGGIFALVGSTGVGKTTTAAKLAAQPTAWA